ncbi:MAG: Trm112 family protein [Promethearchaeota archaeon]
MNDIFPELYFLNKIKIETEIESGLLFCDKCNRWYPIIDTIPQMLPDKYRDKQKDIEFLKINKNLLDEEFFFQNLKPFNI